MLVDATDPELGAALGEALRLLDLVGAQVDPERLGADGAGPGGHEPEPAAELDEAVPRRQPGAQEQSARACARRGSR